MPVVRGHTRRTGMIPVRPYWRPMTVTFFRPRTNPEHQKIVRQLYNLGRDPRGVTALIDMQGDPREVLLAYPKTLTPDQLARVLAHEDLHSTLQVMGLPAASVKLDARRSHYGRRAGSIGLTREGLYRYRPRKHA